METWSGLCRCCLSSESEITITDADTDKIKTKFQEVTSINVTPDDGLPQKICYNCYDRLNEAFHFRTKSIKMNKELKIQLEKFLEQNYNENMDQDEENEIDDDDDDEMDFGSDPVKQLQSMIKSEPTDSDEDCYYVLVVDPKDEKPNQEPKSEEPPIQECKSGQEEVVNIKTEEETEKAPVTVPNEPPQNTFPSSIESFIISDKVPANVPATILENEEETLENENDYSIAINFDDNQTTNDSNSQENDFAIIGEIENDMATQVMTNSDISNEASVVPTDQSNLVKILTTAGPDGTIILKSSDNITYLTDTHLINEEDTIDQSEVIFCEGDENSQFQILKCDGNELVIEYADDSEIATVLQQEDGSFLCGCGSIFEEISEYQKHQLTHHTNEDHLCNLCGKGFESSEILTGHQLLHNVTSIVVLCPFCGQLFRRNSLTQHIKNNHSTNKPVCNICYKRFANSNNLKRHMMIHNGIREFECDICSKRFHQKITMQTHRMTHINPLACNQCDLVFTNVTALEAHKSSEECSKSKFIKVKEELLKTIRRDVTTNGGKIVGYACSLCQKMFSVESALEKHIVSMHMLNAMELLCSECGEIMPTKKDLHSHLQTHKTIKSKTSRRFECSTCGKGCTSQAMLIMHERVHTNERPYACQLCTLRFKTKTHLRTHQLTHTREKKFGCSICMKFFALKGNLVVHLRTHTGERPYVCSLCNESFIDSKYLKKHKVKKHAIDNVPWNQY